MFRDTLERYKKKYEIEMYHGAGHAFLNNPQTKNAANREAAAKSVIKTSKWLQEASRVDGSTEEQIARDFNK